MLYSFCWFNLGGSESQMCLLKPQGQSLWGNIISGELQISIFIRILAPATVACMRPMLHGDCTASSSANSCRQVPQVSSPSGCRQPTTPSMLNGSHGREARIISGRNSLQSRKRLVHRRINGRRIPSMTNALIPQTASVRERSHSRAR